MVPPLVFEPIFKHAIWGGRRLAPWFPTAPDTGTIAEAWVLSDHGSHCNQVRHGPHHGQTLRTVLEAHGPKIYGQSARFVNFPLLLKFIDACEPLSIQVHPDDAFAQKHLNQPRGKTEAWVILHAEPGSRIYAGLRAGADRRAVEQQLGRGSIADLMHSFEPKPGDCVFLRAGTVHAIGAGVTVFEVQQTSDTTFRLDDWGRVDASTGKPRELHLDQGLACTDFSAGPVWPARGEVQQDSPVRIERLAESPYFLLRRLSGREPFTYRTEGQCRALVCTEGRVTISWHDTRAKLDPGQVALIPATVESCDCLVTERFSLLECTPGEGCHAG